MTRRGRWRWPGAEFERRFDERRARYAECDHRVDSDRPVLEVAEEVARLCGG